MILQPSNFQNAPFASQVNIVTMKAEFLRDAHKALTVLWVHRLRPTVQKVLSSLLITKAESTTAYLVSVGTIATLQDLEICLLMVQSTSVHLVTIVLKVTKLSRSLVSQAPLLMQVLRTLIQTLSHSQPIH